MGGGRAFFKGYGGGRWLNTNHYDLQSAGLLA